LEHNPKSEPDLRVTTIGLSLALEPVLSPLWWWEWWSAANFNHIQTNPHQLPNRLYGSQKSWLFEECIFVAHYKNPTITK
jgi:hypothetical protein